MSNTLGTDAAHQQPTPFPDVNLAVNDLLMSIQAVLSGQFTGMYLVGSLALGDFQPRESDLDLIIVTAGVLSDEIIASLRELHLRFDHSSSVWAARVDAAYIPQEALREPSVSEECCPVLHWPEPLALKPLEGGWSIWHHTLREYGVVVSGPASHTLLDHVPPDELRRASA